MSNSCVNMECRQLPARQREITKFYLYAIMPTVKRENERAKEGARERVMFVPRVRLVRVATNIIRINLVYGGHMPLLQFIKS